MSKSLDTWLLPDGVADLLPAQAQQLESLRRQVLDQFAAWGYELVFPPLMEYLESLLTGSGHDLDLMTFKITDQLTGRLMGVRADITPQVARLDAHVIPHQGPARYCYAGTTLNTRQSGLAASRCPIQLGAELYGHAGVESDIEVLRLMLDTLKLAGARQIQLDLGHVGLFRALAESAQLTAADEAQLFDIYQRKAQAELDSALAELHVSGPCKQAFAALIGLSGDESVLARARAVLVESCSDVSGVLQDLEAVAVALKASHPEVGLYFDLTELRGYHYHTGLVFAAYTPGLRQEVAKGGRYDHVGEAFGRARPATGFSVDLKTLLQFAAPAAAATAILAPAGDDAALRAKVAELRAQGLRVVQALPGAAEIPAELGCSQQLVLEAGAWQVIAL